MTVPDTDQGVLFVPYHDTLALLSVEDALAVCEQVYLMHARGSVVLSAPPSFKLDVADGFHNHWHVWPAPIPNSRGDHLTCLAAQSDPASRSHWLF